MSLIATLLSPKANSVLENIIDSLDVNCREIPAFTVRWSVPKQVAHLQFDQNFDLPPKAIIATFQDLIGQFPIDILIHDGQVSSKKLILCDLESTIIKQEMLDEMAKEAGVEAEVATITAKAMNGEIDFKASLEARLRLFADWPLTLLDDMKATITYMEGAKELILGLKERGVKTALISGGFHEFADDIAKDLGFDYVQANRFETVDGHLTGKPIYPIQDPNAKLAALERLCQQMSITPDQAICIGDGANDIPMLQKAGFGVGIRPKKIVARKIANALRYNDLSTLLYL